MNCLTNITKDFGLVVAGSVDFYKTTPVVVETIKYFGTGIGAK